MARRVRSVRSDGDAVVQHLVCAQCELEWNRVPRPGRVPRFCSDACKQAHWRAAQGSNFHRRQAESRRRTRRARLVEDHRRLWEEIQKDGKTLSAQEAWSTLRRLAGANSGDVKTLHRAAAAAWHPDKAGGDETVFLVVQEARRVLASPS